jgi:MFS transporter, CP family, cyanate transporter
MAASSRYTSCAIQTSCTTSATPCTERVGWAAFAHPAGLVIKIEKAPRSLYLGSGVLAFLLLAGNLRPALTGIGPVLEEIRGSLGLSGTAAGLLATLPLLIFAGVSPLARLTHGLGLERTLAGCLALIAAGIALRSAGSAAALFGGTVIFATGIAVANVLVPSLIKRDFPHQIAGMTTAYLMTMTVSAAVASGIAAPLSAHLAGGWQASLAVWAAFAAFSLLCWLPQLRKAGSPDAAAPPDGGTVPVWRSPLAWQITAFMGLQSLFYYVTISWMPVYLADHGISRDQSGVLLTLFQLVSLGAGFVVPALLRRSHDLRPLAVIPSAVSALCVLGLTVAPQWAGLWLTVCGFTLSMTFILAFALVGMRTADHRQAASLSAMAQSIGYLIAAAGPVAFGWMHDLTAGWTVPMAALLAATVIQAVVGFGAGRPGKV